MRISLYAALIFISFMLENGCDTRSPGSLPSSVPQWAREAIWYQIFPERFWNGDSSNDPVLDDIRITWPYLAPAGWRPHPWAEDWYKLQRWEAANQQDFYINAGLRRYGGDLQGVLDRLDYLADLGITAIYFNPLFESPSHHKYDAALYHHIDNNFGPDPEGDRRIWEREDPADPSTWKWTRADSLFLDVIKACHSLGIRVIIDGVFNHVGHRFWAFRDVQKRQQESPYRDWFIISSWDDPVTSADEFSYEGWFGVPELPEIREDENGLAEGFSLHVYHIVRRWMDPDGNGDPSDGIDGWRLDVAEKVSPAFWRKFRGWVKEINPQAYLVGEIWWEDWPRNKMFNASPWLQGDMFDGVMNYRWARAVQQYVIDQEHKIGTSAFVDSLMKIMQDYREENFYASQNLVGSHDVERLASQIVNPDRWLDHGGNPAQNLQFNVRKPTGMELNKQKLIAGMQMTLPGAPMVYYGDEAGMWGGDDPDCRKPMLWPDVKYEPEAAHPYGHYREADEVIFNADLHQWYKKMIWLRREKPALSLGTFTPVEVESTGDVLSFLRQYQEHKVWVVVNSNAGSDTVKCAQSPFGQQPLSNLLSGERWEVADLITGFVIQPYEIMVFELISGR